MDSAELTSNELKCLNRWLTSYKNCINADKTKYMLISSNKYVIFPIIKHRNNKFNETLVIKYLDTHLDKELNFVNYITEKAMKVAKSIGFLYKLQRFIPETILKTSFTSLIHPYLSNGVEAWQHINSISLKPFSLKSNTCNKKSV